VIRHTTTAKLESIEEEEEEKDNDEVVQKVFDEEVEKVFVDEDGAAKETDMDADA